MNEKINAAKAQSPSKRNPNFCGIELFKRIYFVCGNIVKPEIEHSEAIFNGIAGTQTDPDAHFVSFFDKTLGEKVEIGIIIGKFLEILGQVG